MPKEKIYIDGVEYERILCDEGGSCYQKAGTQENSKEFPAEQKSKEQIIKEEMLSFFVSDDLYTFLDSLSPEVLFYLKQKKDEGTLISLSR